MTEREIFFEALELGTPEARAAYLQGACGRDPALRRKVEELLKEHFSNDSLLAGPALEREKPGLIDLPAQEAPAEMLGRYKLLERIGEGGFGVVYVAEQKEPVKRLVAIKIIKLGMDTRQVVARFEAERQALAMMDHPNIAKVLDAGTTDAGRPYFVMELVRGVKITEYCDHNHLTTKERLDLFIKVCQAIQHAHQKGIIHRDIKPSNILLTLHDGVPVPKVIDFGIAKATEGRLTDATVYTQLHQFIGTPAYMSPEQAEMSGLDIDTRSDVYSLGVLLYELLTSKTPFDVKALPSSGLDEMRRRILREEPLRPSTRVSTMADAERTNLAKHRQSDAAKLVHLFRGDLDWIVMKCLEKERSRRYATANGLAADLRRHLQNEPVVARPPSAGYRLLKTWQRNKLAFAAGVAVACSLLLGIVASSWQAFEANRARVAEKAQRLRADAETADARRLLYGANMNLAQQAWEQNNIGHLQELLKETEPSADRGFEWYYWQRKLHLPEKTLRGHSGVVTSAAFSPDATRIVTGGEDRIAKVWEAASGRELAMFRSYPAPIYSATFSPDGLWVANGGEAPDAVLWDAANGRQRRTFQGHRTNVWSVAFSPDGHRIAGGSEDGTAKVWNTETGEQILTLKGHTNRIFSLAFSPDGRLLVTGSHDRTAKIWDAATGREMAKLRGHIDKIWGVAFSPDSRRVVTGSEDTLAMVWEVSSGRELLVLRGHGAGVGPVAFSPDSSRIATGSGDQTIKIWEATTGEEMATLRGHLAWLTSVAFSPDSQFIVSASGDKTAKVWAATRRDPLTLKGHRALVRAVAFSPDGGKIISASEDGTAKVWDANSGRELLTLKAPNDQLLSVAFSSDGRQVLTGTSGNVARLWDAASGRELLTLKGHEAGVGSVAFSPDGRLLLTGSWDNSSKVWNAANGREVLSLSGHSNVAMRPFDKGVNCAVFSPDGRRIATASWDKTAKVWDAVTGRELLTFRAHNAPINSIAFSPDGLRVVTGGEDQTARVWEANTGRELATLTGHSSTVMSVAFSPDGKRIVTGSVDQSAKLWETGNELSREQRARELLTLKGHTALIYSVAFSPDGQRIATAGADQTVKVWEAASPQQVAAWRKEEITDAR